MLVSTSTAARLTLAVAVAVLACWAGCADDTPVVPPMTPVRFDVVETLVENTCGPQSVQVQPVVRYQVDLNVDQTRSRWRVVGTNADAAGSYDERTRAFEFASDSSQQLRAANQRYGIAACVMRRLDVIDGTLSGELPHGDAGLDEAGTDVVAGIDAAIDDAGEPGDAAVDGGDAGPSVPAAFAATETIVYGPVSGADCRDFVGANDGQYLTLPCEQRYQVVGTLTAP